MRNPTRRNRNIGTAKQGHGQANKLTIPTNNTTLKAFVERLTTYEKMERIVNGHTFLFVIETTSPHYAHACSVDDIAHMMSLIIPADFGGLKLIVLRQPKKKEEILSPVWGRFIYSYAFENDYYWAIILEAFNTRGQIKWPKKLNPDDQKSLERLKMDGHQFVEDKRSYTAPMTIEHVRNTQLYSTLPHELGHFIQYYRLVEQTEVEDEPFEAWEQRSEAYHRIPSQEREQFANRYADEVVARLREKGLVPF